MKLLVTGGCGFIGSNFIRYWLKKYPNDKITNLDKLTYAGHLSSTKDFSRNNNYKFVRGDICDLKTVDKVMEGVEIVVHFAAESHVDRSITGPKVFIKTNIVGTQVLMDSALKYGIKRFHHVSTDEVFGELPLGKGKFTTDSKYNPRSPYSASKAASDHLIRAYHETYGLPVTITNSSNNYGPFQDPEKFLPRMITNLIDNQPVPIYGDGKYVRDWLNVIDHVAAIEAVIKKGKDGETYLVGGQTEDKSNLQIALKLLNFFGRDKSYIKFVKDRPGHDRRYAIDWSQTKKSLGWQPEFDFDTWLGETVEWYRDNEWWWRPLKAGAEKLYAKTGQK